MEKKHRKKRPYINGAYLATLFYIKSISQKLSCTKQLYKYLERLETVKMKNYDILLAKQ